MPSSNMLERLWPLVLGGIAACAAPAPAVLPKGPEPGPPPVAAPSASAAAPASAMPPQRVADVAPLEVVDPEPEEPAPPEVTIRIEEPYKLDERPPPTSQEEYARDIYDRRHWNKGGTGELVGDLPGVEGHPDPRIIVNVDDVKGGHPERKLVVHARKYHWIQSVRCYRLGAFKDRHLRGWTRGMMTLDARGRVTRVKLLETDLDDQEVADCLVDKLRALPPFPAADRGSTATVSVRVGPGDEPMPPPKDLIVPGEGSLSVAAMREGVEKGLEAFEACYRSAFAYAPGLWGRIILRFHVTERGKLDEAFEAGSRFPDARVSQCVVHAARELTFPRPDGGDIRFVVPLRLSNQNADTTAPPRP